MEDIKVDGIPVLIGDKKITHFTVDPMNFSLFVVTAEKSNAAVTGGGKKWAMHNRRQRMLLQLKAYAGAARVEVDELTISQIPIPYVKKIMSAMEAGANGTPGTIITPKADGISSPIIFKLGTPIKFKNGTDEGSFDEIEFQARTFGDIEEILAEGNSMPQTLTMLKTIAKPLGMSDNLQAMPSWAIDALSMADSFEIMEKVLPRFLE